MKKVLSTVLLLSILSTVSIAQNVYFEDFNSCSLPTGWINTAILGDTAWVIGDNALGSPGGSVDGSCMAYVHDDDLGGGYPEVIMELESAPIDNSNLDTAVLKFDYVFEDLAPSYFSVSLWNGSAWTTVFTENSDPGCFGFYPDCSARQAEIPLTSEYMISDFKMKFTYADGNGWQWYVGIDNVALYVPPTNDAAVAAVVSPLNGCGLGTEVVSLDVYNNGSDAITSFDASYELNGNIVTESFTVNIASAGTETISFSVPVDLSVPGSYDIIAWIELNEDVDATNDTIAFTVESIPVVGALPYAEDFENGAGGWTSGGTNNTWELGAPTGAFINGAASGSNAWVTNLDGDYVDGMLAYVESPCFDLSTLLIDPIFRFNFISNSEVGWDGAWVAVSTDAGTTWNTVGSVGEGTNWYNNADEHGANFDEDWWDAPYAAAGVWTTATHLLDGAAGSSSVKVRVFFGSDGSISDFEGFGFDDIQIFEQPSINAGVVEIISPVTGCGLGTENVTVVIENFGDADLTNFSVSYDAGSGVVTELFNETLLAATTDTFTFAASLDLSISGDYDFAAWTEVAGDGDMLNDTLFSLVTSAPVISALPYAQDFENGSGGWYSTGEEGIWELGDPEGTLIDTANSGVNAWATNLNTLNYANGQVSYLISPCFDFSGLVIDPILNFAFISDSETFFDGMWLEVSTDAGATWSTVGNFEEGENWYNNEDQHGANFDEDWWDGTTSGWVNAEHLLDGVAGSSDVIVRFVFISDLSVNGFEGFAVDDINITEQPAVNSAVTAIVSPVSACELTNAETVTVAISNVGSTVMDSVIVSYSLNNGTPITQVFNQSLAVGQGANFTFLASVDLSANQDYNLSVWTETVGDGDLSNDTITLTVTSIPTISTVPYFEDFENGTGGWTSVGVVTPWQLGDPEGTDIDTAFSGVNAWATNLNTLNYENSEISVLQSPCFDFSSVTDDPVISFAIIHSAEQNFDGTWLEVSTDGGTTWSTVGNLGEGENWYTSNGFFNAFIEQGWTGASGGNVQWVIAEHILNGVAGESAVKVRFVFSSDPSVNFYEGFAIDDISIHPQAQLDLVVLEFNGPADGCSLGEEPVSFTFWNKGLQTVSNFPVGFIVDGGTAQTETYAGQVAQGDTVTYTFLTELADLSVPSAHSIDVFTGLAGDEYTDTDTLYNNTVTNFGSATPFEQTETPGTPISVTIVEGTSSEMFFCGLPPSLDGCVEIAYVSIDSLSHTWLSDLVITLISPAGDSLLLSANNGGSGDNMSDVIFTAQASEDITLQTADIQPGTYMPQDPDGFTSLYNGQDPNGAWTLLVQDLFGGDDGILHSWSMSFVDNSPTPMLTNEDTVICLNHVLTIGITETYDSYLWSTGHNTQSIELFGSVLGLGDHEIAVTVDQNGCTGMSNSFTVTVDACLGVTELDGLSVNIYPNPSSGQIVLDVTGESEALMLTLVDMHGKLVYTETLNAISNGLRKQIDLGELAKGVYFVRLEAGNDSMTRKLVIQ